MKRKLRTYYPDIVAVTFTLVAGLLGIAAEHFEIPLGFYLPVLVGFLIAATVAILRSELTQHLDNRLRHSRLLGQIEDPVLRERGEELLDICEIELQDLTRGILNLPAHQLYDLAIKKADESRTAIRASHFVPDISFMHAWEEIEGLKNYYAVNLKAIQRGVTIERIFLTHKANLVDDEDKKVIDDISIRVMKQQQKDRIAVSVVWIESVDNVDLVEDFIIYDNREVLVHYPTSVGGYNRLSIRRKSAEVRTYEQKFDALKAAGQSLDKFLGVYATGTPETKE